MNRTDRRSEAGRDGAWSKADDRRVARPTTRAWRRPRVPRTADPQGGPIGTPRSSAWTEACGLLPPALNDHSGSCDPRRSAHSPPRPHRTDRRRCQGAPRGGARSAHARPARATPPGPPYHCPPALAPDILGPGSGSTARRPGRSERARRRSSADRAWCAGHGSPPWLRCRARHRRRRSASAVHGQSSLTGPNVSPATGHRRDDGRVHGRLPERQGLTGRARVGEVGGRPRMTACPAGLGHRRHLPLVGQAPERLHPIVLSAAARTKPGDPRGRKRHDRCRGDPDTKPTPTPTPKPTPKPTPRPTPTPTPTPTPRPRRPRPTRDHPADAAADARRPARRGRRHGVAPGLRGGPGAPDHPGPDRDPIPRTDQRPSTTRSPTRSGPAGRRDRWRGGGPGGGRTGGGPVDAGPIGPAGDGLRQSGAMGPDRRPVRMAGLPGPTFPTFGLAPTLVTTTGVGDHRDGASACSEAPSARRETEPG